jgi:hypothetical protein
MKLLHICLIMVLVSCFQMKVMAQKDRYKFAQSYLGLQADALFGASDGISNSGAARLTLGGTHFWYKADFYISFPLYSFSSGSGEGNFSEGIITGARYLPLGLGKKWPTPFVGIQWITPTFSVGEGPEWQRSRLGLEAGFTLVVRKRHTIEASLHYITNAELDYPVSRTESAVLRHPNIGISVCVKRYLDFTAGNSSEAGKEYILKTTEKFKEVGALSAWSLAAGLSTNLPLKQFEFAKEYAFLPESSGLELVPEIATGYYFHKADMAVRATYRYVQAGQSAFDLNWTLKEHRMNGEVFKFLFDYNGFVPFLGLGIGAAHSSLTVTDEIARITDVKGWRPDVALVFGWDIRPTDIDWFILRTNLRYSPSLNSTIEGVNISTNHLEINFIQFVMYPKRFKNQKQ